jgi:DNA-3-methyladenine glycosylase I
MDQKHRCWRCLRDQLYIDYHDHEWWVPVHDDAKHFEFLLLETFQAWLSRYTILSKRENFRLAFDNFDPAIISHYTDEKVEQLMSNAGIIRHRGKILAAISNARIFLQIQAQYGSWDKFIRAYTDWQVINNHKNEVPLDKGGGRRPGDLPIISTSPLSDQISKDLRKLGMKFVGSTTIYAHLQATGQINDHEVSCHKYNITQQQQEL